MHLTPLLFILLSMAKAFTLSAGIAIVAMVILLICSALMSGSEMAFFSLGPAHLNELRARKSKTDNQILSLLEHPKKLLATILIANNFINIAIVIISTYLTQTLFDFKGLEFLGFVVQFIIVASLILFIGEIMPKILASQKAMSFAALMSGPMPFLIKLFHPLSIIMVHSTRFLERRIEKKGHNISIDDLNEVIDITSTGDTHEQEKNILKGIVKFGDIEVKEVLKSRVDVIAIEESAIFPQVLHQILNSGFSRLPVFKENLDNITGVLYIKDLLPYLNKDINFNWQTLVRPALFIPENKKISDLLIVFKEKKIHLAIVVDEFGGTSGIITLEDIIEEIVGEINDEYDDEPMENFFSKIDENTYIFEAKTSINDFIKIIGCPEDIFDNILGEFDSLAGLILEITGKIPQKNEKINYKRFQFKIESVDNRRIKQIRVTITKDELPKKYSE
jgi:putative hemolysin